MRSESKSVQEYEDEIAAHWALCKKSMTDGRKQLTQDQQQLFFEQAWQDFQKIMGLIGECSRSYGKDKALQMLQNLLTSEEDYKLFNSVSKEVMDVLHSPPKRGGSEHLA